MDIDQAPASDEVPGSEVKFQIVACRKAMPDDGQRDPPPPRGYATAEDAAARCTEMGFDTSDLEEDGDSFLFHQRSAPECKDAGEPEITDLEDGMKAIGCGKAAAIGGMPGEGESDADHGYDEVPPTKTVRRIPVVKGTLVSGGERAAVAGGNADTIPRVPAGAQFVKDYGDHHKAGLALHEEHAGMLENPAIAAAHAKWQQEDLSKDDEMNGLISELYPEVTFPDQPEPMPSAAPGAAGDVLVDPLVKAVGADGGNLDGVPGTGDLGEVAAMTPDDDMPYGASYLQKIKGHCDAGQSLLTAGLKKQEHPKVIDWAENEAGRLEKRKGLGKKLMSKHYADHVAKVFGTDEPDSIDTPKPEDAGPDAETKIGEGDDVDLDNLEPDLDLDAEDLDGDGDVDADDAEIAGEIDAELDAEAAIDADEDADADDEDDEPAPKKPKKAARRPAPAPRKPATTTELLREVVKGLSDLTQSVARRKATARPAPASRRPAAKPAAVAEPEPEPAPDPATVRQLALLQKQVAVLVEREKRFQMKLAARMAKKKACECGGSCGSCQEKNYFAKDLSAIDESAGAAVVKPVTTAKETVEDCVSRCRAKKNYHIAATLKGRAIVIKAGHKIPFFAEDWRIEDENGNRFDNQSFASHRDAEKMLLQLV